MRALLKPLFGKYAFSTKKLGIADTAQVIVGKILNITQSVHYSLSRTTLNSLEQLSPLETVLLESSDSLRSKQDRW